MSLTLHLDTEAWRAHLHQVRDAVGSMVPVAKGNGYGFGLARLAHEATLLGAEYLAVGTVDEVSAVRPVWSGPIIVLTPLSRHDPLATELLDDEQVITTVSRLDDLALIARDHPGARVIVEVLTTMRRHGLPTSELGRVDEFIDDLVFEGWTIHLPMVGDTLAEARQLARKATGVVSAPLWLSHLSAENFATLTREVDVETHLRVGTKLWLGAPRTRRTTSRILDMHPVKRGEKVGYWQHRVPVDGWVVVLSGGTAHGLALEAPTAGANLGQRARALVTGSMEAAGLALSPFTIAGKKRFFIEPPHMQSSLVFLPGAGRAAVGDEVPVELRLTTATVERIIESDPASPFPSPMVG